jgi:hypothetical protein
MFLPMDIEYKKLRQAVREGLDLELTPEMVREGLWLIFSDSIVFRSLSQFCFVFLIDSLASHCILPRVHNDA